MTLCRPAVQSTHIKAMDEILDLSVEDFELRAVFKSLRATHAIWDSIKSYSAFRRSEYDGLLLASSRKALICFEEPEIALLLQKWIQSFSLIPTSFSWQIRLDLQIKIAPYLQ